MLLMTLACGVISSVIHEMEHDYIHGLMGTKNKTKDFLFWILQPYKPLLELRRYVHLKHHKDSGSTSEDYEEILLGSYAGKVEKAIAVTVPMAYTIYKINVMDKNERLTNLYKKTFKWNLVKYSLYAVSWPVTLPWLLGSWLHYSSLTYAAQRTHNHSDDGKALPLNEQSKEYYGLGAYLTAPFNFGFCFTHNFHHHKVKVPFYKRKVFSTKVSD